MLTKMGKRLYSLRVWPLLMYFVKPNTHHYLVCLSVSLSVCIPSYLSVCPSIPLHASWNNQLQKIYPELFRISYQIDFITCVIGEILFRLNKPLLFISVEHAYVSMWILFLSHNVFKSVRYLYTLVLHPLPDIVHMVYAMWE